MDLISLLLSDPVGGALTAFGVAYAFMSVIIQGLVVCGAILSGHSHQYLVNGQWVNIIQTY